MEDERNIPQDEDAEVEAHHQGHKRSDEPAVREDEDEVEAHHLHHHSPQARMERSE